MKVRGAEEGRRCGAGSTGGRIGAAVPHVGRMYELMEKVGRKTV